MATITIEVNTFEEVLNLQNIAATRYNQLLEGKANGHSAKQVLICLMWKQIYLDAGQAMKELQADVDDLPFVLDEGTL